MGNWLLIVVNLKQNKYHFFQIKTDNDFITRCINFEFVANKVNLIIHIRHNTQHFTKLKHVIEHTLYMFKSNSICNM